LRSKEETLISDSYLVSEGKLNPEVPAVSPAPATTEAGPADALKKPLTEKELAKKRAKEEKARKFAEKQAAKAAGAATAAPTQTKKEKAVKEAAAAAPEYVEETPAGDKKILKPLANAYDPIAVESAWYSWWEKEQFFKPEYAGLNREEGTFVIVAPPPNVTGALHMGHALAASLQDTLIRWNRMLGKTVLFLPGCDHASISTQSVVENMLWRREKKTRYDLGREKMMALIWDWKEEYHQKINKVLRKLGNSHDWDREAFTMDENVSLAVNETFVKLYEEGIIYRSNRLVNWSTKLNTGISNLEIDSKELKGRTLLTVPGYDKKVEFGVITHFKYPVDGEDTMIEVATTRPETMLGDTAIAVHPKDPRYLHLIGKNAKHPFVDRLLPIVADDYVDPEFGTGAVKITPAHDANDFNLGKRHNLEFINILNDDGTLNSNAGPYNGQKRFDVRYSVVADLKAKGLYVKTEDNPMVVPLCQKSRDVIEPLLKPQWWMRMRDLADEAIKAVKDGKIKIKPQTSEKEYFRWLEGIQDWCLSRQLWWGIQPPAWFVKIEGETSDDTDTKNWVVARTIEDAEAQAKEKFPGKKFVLERDPDVLDTWVSSGLWPFATMGWPKQTPDYANFHPTAILETGWDILFFWVARMIMLGLKLTGDVPFREVYCHALIRDSEGRKMSKSLGNVVDPLDIISGIPLEKLHEKLYQGVLDPAEIENAIKYQKKAFPDGIPQCGTDAMRFALCAYSTGGMDINMDIKVIHGYRKFCNKIYQATRFVLGKLGDDFMPHATSKKSGHESVAERWILHQLNHAAITSNKALEARDFQAAASAIYFYWYNQLCDVFIENSKYLLQDGSPEVKESVDNTLYTAIEGALLLIHPIMPYISEELWQRLPRRPEDKTPSISVASYPKPRDDFNDPEAEKAYQLVLDVSKGIRSLISSVAIKDHRKSKDQSRGVGIFINILLSLHSCYR
jgi:valyl-tRNA synthetase